MCGLLVLRNLCLLYHQSQTLEYCKTFKRIKKNKQTWNEWNQIQHFKASTCLSLCCHSVSWGQRAGSCASAFESRPLIGWFARPTLPWTNQSEAWSSKHLCFQNTFHMIIDLAHNLLVVQILSTKLKCKILDRRVADVSSTTYPLACYLAEMVW